MRTQICSLLVLGLGLLLAQDLVAQQAPDQIPDAPSATRPIPSPEEPSPRPGADESAAPASSAPPAGSSSSLDLPRTPAEAAPASDQTQAPPMPPVKTVPPGSVPPETANGESGYVLPRVTTNLVIVPVTVKDSDGRMVNGLQPRDFTVLENGQRQTLKFFTSDPFALSAAVVIDLGMPDVGVKKVQQTLSALQGAFSQFDEIAIYTYSTKVGRQSDFTGVGRQLTAVMNQIKSYSGESNGPPVTDGPLGPQGPIINGMPIDAPVTPVSTPPRVAHVINDAILTAARDLSKQPRERRKIIFVISDGRELGSTASYQDTLKVLLTQNITVYGVGVEGAAIPIYDRLQRIHLPKTRALLGYSDILPKYVSATGGGAVYAELTAADIERAYASAIGEARNQYTIGYSSKGIGGYRQIEVRVHRPNLKVYAKDGYYPLPAAR
ncbi:MAG TPA: VWA domain-containing protein [Terriglobales bacterium]|nr:VWA domain-containing protein [Terriglobales bacterium]